MSSPSSSHKLFLRSLHFSTDLVQRIDVFLSGLSGRSVCFASRFQSHCRYANSIALNERQVTAWNCMGCETPSLVARKQMWSSVVNKSKPSDFPSVQEQRNSLKCVIWSGWGTMMELTAPSCTWGQAEQMASFSSFPVVWTRNTKQMPFRPVDQVRPSDPLVVHHSDVICWQRHRRVKLLVVKHRTRQEAAVPRLGVTHFITASLAPNEAVA